MNRLINISFGLATAVLIQGCTKHPTDPQDPYERMNRSIYHMNVTIDKTLYRPVAVVYKTITPPPLRRGITNAFDNLLVPDTFVNDILQGKVHYAIRDIGRFVINSTLGIGGLFDVASHMNIEKHENDFGKTFAFYSQNKKSAFIMAPFLGPTTIRDGLGFPFDIAANPLTYLNSQAIKYSLGGLYYVNLRANLLPMDKMIDDSYDPYAAIRNAYLQYRNNAVIKNAEQGDYKFGQLDSDQQPAAAGANNSSATPPPPADEFSVDAPSKPEAKKTTS